eukprot:jgi/Chrzof1/6883/Cz02g02020.t1
MNVWSAETGQCLAVSEPADNSINALTGKSQLFAPQPDLHNCPDRNPTASGGHCSSTQALCTAAGGSTVCLDIVRPQRMYGTAFSSCDLSEVEAIGAMREGDAICSCTCVLPAECFGSGSSCTVHVISYTGIIRHCLREDEKVLAAFSRFWTESLSALWKTREGAYGLPAPGKVFLGPLYESSSWPPPENPLDSVIRAFQTLLDSMSQSSCSKMKCMLLLLPLSNPSKICLKETPTTVLLWELIMRSWEQGLVLGSRRLHQQLYQQYMRPLAEQSPTLFMLYLKGATVQLPGTMQWPRTGICDGTAIDGLLPPVQLTLFGWAPWPQQHEGPPSRFSWDLWSMPRRPANRMYVASWNYFRLWWWLREPEQQEQRQMPYMVASHMIPMPGAVGVLERKDSSLLLDIVKCNLPAEAYSLPLVRALVHIKWQVYGASAVIAVLILEVILVVAFSLAAVQLPLIISNDQWPQGAQHAILSVCIVISTMSLVLGGMELLSVGWRHHLRSFWNWMEIISYLMMLVICGQYMYLVRLEEYRQDLMDVLQPMVAAQSILMWLRLIKYIAVLPRIGFLVQMVLGSVQDVLQFIVLLGGLAAGFTFSLYLMFAQPKVCIDYWRIKKANATGQNHTMEQLHPSFEGCHNMSATGSDVSASFGDWKRTVVTVYAMMLGAFQVTDFYSTPYSGLSICVFMLFSLLVMMVLLNLIIAIISNVYERSYEGRNQQFIRARAEILCELEARTPPCVKQWLGLKDCYHGYLHYLEPVNQCSKQDKTDNQAESLHSKFALLVDTLFMHDQKCRQDKAI